MKHRTANLLALGSSSLFLFLRVALTCLSLLGAFGGLSDLPALEYILVGLAGAFVLYGMVSTRTATIANRYAEREARQNQRQIQGLSEDMRQPLTQTASINASPNQLSTYTAEENRARYPRLYRGIQIFGLTHVSASYALLSYLATHSTLGAMGTTSNAVVIPAALLTAISSVWAAHTFTVKKASDNTTYVLRKLVNYLKGRGSAADQIEWPAVLKTALTTVTGVGMFVFLLRSFTLDASKKVPLLRNLSAQAHEAIADLLVVTGTGLAILSKVFKTYQFFEKNPPTTCQIPSLTPRQETTLRVQLALGIGYLAAVSGVYVRKGWSRANQEGLHNDFAKIAILLLSAPSAVFQEYVFTVLAAQELAKERIQKHPRIHELTDAEAAEDDAMQLKEQELGTTSGDTSSARLLAQHHLACSREDSSLGAATPTVLSAATPALTAT